MDVIRLSEDGLPEDLSGSELDFCVNVYQCHFGKETISIL